MTKLFIMGIFSSLLSLINCRNTQTAEKIKINELESQLLNLSQGKTEYDFIGITSNGIDCIYFIKDGDKFQIDFEAMSSNQIAYIEKLRKYAERKNIKTQMKTYGNKTVDNSNEKAPVIHLLTNSNLSETAEIGSDIQNEVFGNSIETIYDVVP